MGNLHCPTIKKQFLDANGDPLSGGKLYTYEAGTTTLLTTYTTQDGSTPNANPIILNSRGEVPTGIFLAADSYKFVLKDSDDNTIYTVDNITVVDHEAEHDALALRVTALEAQVEASGSPGTIANRLISGAKSTVSSIARFLVPIGSSNQVKVLATTTDLVFVVDETQYTVEADITASGLSSPETSNNTAAVNDSNLSDDNFTKQLGEFGSAIPIDTVGSKITALNGTLAAFKIAGVATEYFIARVDTTNGLLTEAMRGYFYDSSGDPIERTAFSNNDVITLMKLTWVYLKTNGTVIVSYTEPTYSTTEPTSPSDGDMWFDLANEKWKKFTSTTWEDQTAAFIGTCIQDENGNTVAARSADFYKDVKDDNTFEIEYKSATEVQSKSKYNTINVYGTKVIANESKRVWDISSDLESGQAEAASTEYYFYIKENGDLQISETAPHDRRGDLRGLYHSYETWRYVGKIDNNASSNFDEHSIENSPEVINLADLKNMKVGDTYNIGLKNATTTNANDTIKITSRDHTPLSQSNPGYVCIEDTVAGKAKIFKVIADVTILLTGAHWGLGTKGDFTDYPLSVYAVNNDGVLTWAVSAIPNHKLISNSDDSATQSSITQVNHFLVKSALTADAQCIEVGWFKANFDDTAGAAEDLWAIQTGDGDINLGACPPIWKAAGAIPFSATTTPPTKGTTETMDLYFWMRLGDMLLMRLAYGQTSAGGAAGTGIYLIPLPTGLVANAAKNYASTTVNDDVGWDSQCVGIGKMVQDGGHGNNCTAHLYNTTNLCVQIGIDGELTAAATTYATSGDAWDSGLANYSFSANLNISFPLITIPVTGWEN